MSHDAAAPRVARIWIGHTRPEDREEYVRYLEKSGMAEYRVTPGNLGAWLLVREVEGQAEFLTFSFWDSWESIRRFAGPDPELARYFPDDERYLLEFPETVQHFEVCLPSAERGQTEQGR
jgi:heme-degrading monooxygenase HmoA